VTPDNAESYRIETTKEKIDEFEARLKSLGFTPVRETKLLLSDDVIT
jgi:hypothetical protein